MKLPIAILLSLCVVQASRSFAHDTWVEAGS